MNKYLIILIGISAIILASCGSAVDLANTDTSPKTFRIGDKYTGKATYYADKFNGLITASGEYHDMEKFTAAHRTFPFGTVVQVKNLKNNRTVKVRINDRGPAIADRIIDLSKAAAEKLDMIGQGVQPVEIIIIELPVK